MNGPRWALFAVTAAMTAGLLLVITSHDHTGWWLLLVVVAGLPLQLTLLVLVYRRRLRALRPARELDIADHVPPELLRDLGHDVPRD